jgi:mono/diheme cytochrome c family protein
VRQILGAALVVTLLAIPAVGSAQGQASKGQQVFATQKCTICHSIAGEGNKKGPLDGVGVKLSADEIRQWITNAPDMAAKAKAERKPPMKPFTLPKDELDDLVAYLQTLKK